MTPALLASALCLFSALFPALFSAPFSIAQQSGPPAAVPPAPPSNTFITAAETVLDDAANVDIKAPEDRFQAQMSEVKTAKDNLDHMAYEDKEHSIVTATSELLFAISACHIQSRDGADLTKCQAQIDNARRRAMDAMGKHKNGSAWVDGPPS
jgi:hypothetical protein